MGQRSKPHVKVNKTEILPQTLSNTKTILNVENFFLIGKWKITDIESYNLRAGKKLGGHQLNLTPASGIHVTASLLSSDCTVLRLGSFSAPQGSFPFIVGWWLDSCSYIEPKYSFQKIPPFSHRLNKSICSSPRELFGYFTAVCLFPFESFSQAKLSLFFQITHCKT